MIDFRGWVKEKTSMKKTYIDEHVKAKMRKHYHEGENGPTFQKLTV